MKQLRNEIEQLNNQNRLIRQQLETMNDQKIQEFQQKFKQELLRFQTETDAEYTQQLQQLHQQVQSNQTLLLEDLKKQADEIIKMQNEKILELTQCITELQNGIQRIQQNSENKKNNNNSLAHQALIQATSARDCLSEVPHEFFFSGEYDIIEMHFSHIQSDMDMELYEAAIADANAVEMEFELLRLKSNRKLDEWIQAFNDYSNIIFALADRLEIIMTNPIHTLWQQSCMKENELNFWSSGMFKPLKEKIQNEIYRIKKIQEIGVIAHLKNAPATEQLTIFQEVKNVRKLEDEVTAVIGCITNERRLSDERYYASKEIEKALMELGLSCVKSGFRRPSPELLQEPWFPYGLSENPMDSHDTLMTPQRPEAPLDILNITIVPIRMHGVTVRNEIVLWYVPSTLTDQQHINASCQSAVEAISNIPIIGSRCHISVLENIDNHLQEETIRKSEPNPALQAHYLALKYH